MDFKSIVIYPFSEEKMDALNYIHLEANRLNSCLMSLTIFS